MSDPRFTNADVEAFIKKHKGTIHTREFPTRCGTCRFIERFKAAENVIDCSIEFLNEECSMNENGLLESIETWREVTGE
jgi:hypothetical protein